MQERLVQTWRNFVTCFTILMICYVLFQKIGWFEELNTRLVGQLLSICAVVCLTQFATSYLPLHSFFLQACVSFVDMIVVVFFMGIVVFDMFEINRHMLIIILGLLFVVFFVTVMISYLIDFRSILAINKIIKNREKQK